MEGHLIWDPETGKHKRVDIYQGHERYPQPNYHRQDPPYDRNFNRPDPDMEMWKRDMASNFADMKRGMNEIHFQIKQQEEQKERDRAGNERLGIHDYDLHSKQQIEMIGNTFYNMLTLIGKRDKDTRFLELSE